MQEEIEQLRTEAKLFQVCVLHADADLVLPRRFSGPIPSRLSPSPPGQPMRAMRQLDSAARRALSLLPLIPLGTKRSAVVLFSAGQTLTWSAFFPLQDCLPPESENECLICRDKHQHVKRMVESYEQTASNHDEVCCVDGLRRLGKGHGSRACSISFSFGLQFTKQLEGADNRFSVVANYFGLNLFREVSERSAGRRASGRILCLGFTFCAAPHFPSRVGARGAGAGGGHAGVSHGHARAGHGGRYQRRRGGGGPVRLW